jgi:hypothetical protein
MKNANIETRIEKSLAFLENKTPGTFLFMRSGYGVPGYEGFWVNKFHDKPVEYYLDRKKISHENDEFLKEFRSEKNRLLDLDDDAVPNIEVYFSIGSITSMMSGAEVHFASGTGWSSPCFEPEQIDLTFDPNNPWVQFHLMTSEDLIKKWDGDFTLIPCFYRSPLDAANGLLGDKIFLMMHDDCDTVLRVVMGCVEWSLKMEDFLNSNLKWPQDLHRGVWGVALPNRAVFVNGDPVDLISGEMQQKLDKPSSDRLFIGAGGGFFHHHALGIRQAINLSYTNGMLVQNIYTDPNVDVPAYLILKDEDVRNSVIEASLRTPIHINTDFLPIIKDFIPILKKGCFILRQDNGDTAAETLDILRENGY